MIKETNTYHTPVLLDECIEALDIKPEGVYVDATYGGGGHSRPILNQMNAKGRLFGFDQDEQTQSNLIEDSRFTFIRANFQYLPQFMRYYNVERIDGILADLGVSSFHFDEPSRGFSYRFDTVLDMRMNQSALLSAKDVLASYDQASLQRMFSNYGEVRNAKTLSQRICNERKSQKIERVSHLLSLIDQVYMGDKQKYRAQVFQAIRIEVNDEIELLKKFLTSALEILASKGRLVVISYHSVEDAAIKKVMKDYVEVYDEYGRIEGKAKLLTKKPIVPSEIEIKKNRRATSAKLRAIMKT